MNVEIEKLLKKVVDAIEVTKKHGGQTNDQFVKLLNVSEQTADLINRILDLLNVLSREFGTSYNDYQWKQNLIKLVSDTLKKSEQKKSRLRTEQYLRKVIRRIIKEELNEQKREIRQSDLIDRYYPQLKRMVDDGNGEFDRVVREIDKRWEGPYTDVYDVVELISDAADAARVAFNYNRMESDLVSLFK